jgi:hypothetical protein
MKDSCYTPRRYQYFFDSTGKPWGNSYVAHDNESNISYAINTNGTALKMRLGAYADNVPSGYWQEVPADKIVELGLILYEG